MIWSIYPPRYNLDHSALPIWDPWNAGIFTYNFCDWLLRQITWPSWQKAFVWSSDTYPLFSRWSKRFVFLYSIGSPGYVRLRTCCFFILPQENERSLWAVRSKTQYQVIQIWPFDPLFGGHPQPFKGSRIRTPQKGHQQNCQLFLVSLIFVEPARGIFVQDFLDMLFWIESLFLDNKFCCGKWFQQKSTLQVTSSPTASWGFFRCKKSVCGSGPKCRIFRRLFGCQAGMSCEPWKNPPTFHYTGWLIGILIMVYEITPL